MAARWATFDCHGTLVDWNAGVGGELARLFGDGDRERLLARCHELEPVVQAADSGLSYRAVLAATLREVALSQGLEVPAGEEDALAREIGSYKPALGHWRSFEQRLGRLPDAHVAASLFHDVGPAAELGIPNVWINRLGERPEQTMPDRELPDLDGLAEALDELGPARPTRL
jgi:2-haloacid dehalogenase